MGCCEIPSWRLTRLQHPVPDRGYFSSAQDRDATCDGAARAIVPLKRWLFEVDDATADDHALLMRALIRACVGAELATLQAENAMWVNECIHAAYVASDTRRGQPVSLPSS